MTRYRAAALLCLVALSLAGCNDTHTAAANPKICMPFKPAKAAAEAVADVGAVGFDDCLRRWAYSLAPSRDAAEVVAEATVGACNAQLAKWNGRVLGETGGVEPGAASLTTGQPTTPIAEHNAFGRAHALLYVVQARAGACAPPPATNGVPDGVG